MSNNFELFIRHKNFVENCSPKTLPVYRQSWKTFKRMVGDKNSKESITEFVMRMREARISPATCNVYIKGMNGLPRRRFQPPQLC